MRASHRHVLRTLAAVSPARRVFLVPCGDGTLTVALARLGFDIHACDPNPDAVEATRRRLDEEVGVPVDPLRVRHAPGGTADHPEASFDWVIAHRVHRGRSSPAAVRRYLGTLAGLLRPGGWLVLTARVPDEASGASEWVEALAREVGLAVAEDPAEIEEEGEVMVQGILRRPVRREAPAPGRSAP